MAGAYQRSEGSTKSSTVRNSFANTSAGIDMVEMKSSKQTAQANSSLRALILLRLRNTDGIFAFGFGLI